MGHQCVSRCDGCGDICEAVPISTLTSLQIYSNKNCTILSGDLYLTNLDIAVTIQSLTSVFSFLQVVRGSIYIIGNPLIWTTVFLRTLVEVNNIYISNNPSLIDTSFLSLQTVHGVISVTGCDRLCPALHPTAPYRLPTNTTGCTKPAVVILFHIDGPATAADFPTIASLIAALVRNATSQSV